MQTPRSTPSLAHLTARLSALSLGLTVAVVAALVVSPWWGAALAIVGGIAIVGAGITPRAAAPHDDARDDVVALVLAAIVLQTALASCRFAAGLPEQLAAVASSAFVPSFPIDDTSWFVTFAVLPISAMLFGAWALTRHRPLGRVMAWWIALYVGLDALLQLRLPSLDGAPHPVWHVVGGVVAAAQLAVAVVAIARLARDRVPPPPPDERAPTPRQRNLWTLVFVGLVVPYGAVLLQQGGPLPVGVIVGSMMGGLVGWRRTTALRPGDPATLVPPYLSMLGLFYVHVGEEAVTSFNRAIAAISGTPWDDREFTLLIGLLGPVVWFGAAWSLWHRQAFGNFVLWFMVVGMILGEPAHLVVFPVVAMVQTGGDYGYFSGMYTALFPMVPAILILVTLLRDHRAAKAVAT